MSNTRGQSSDHLQSGSHDAPSGGMTKCQHGAAQVGEKKEEAEESRSAREASGVNFIIRTVQDHDDTRHFVSCFIPEIRGQTTHCTPLNDFSSSHKGFFFLRLNLPFVISYISCFTSFHLLSCSLLFV